MKGPDDQPSHFFFHYFFSPCPFVKSVFPLRQKKEEDVHFLHYGYILIGKCHDSSRCFNCYKLVQSICQNICLHLDIVRLTGICTHRYERRYSPWRTGLSYYRRKGRNYNCRYSSFLDRSLHYNCRAVASASASCHDNSINIFILQFLSNRRTCFICENFNISSAAHETEMHWRNTFDYTFCGKFIQAV